MAQTIGYQRGTVGLGALNNANSVLFTYSAGETAPIRVINAGINLVANNTSTGNTAMCMQLGVRQGNDASRGTVVAGLWAKIPNAPSSANVLTSIDLRPSSSILTSNSIPGSGGSGFTPQGNAVVITTPSGSPMALNDPSIRTFTSGGIVINFAEGNVSSPLSCGTWEINPPYFWMLPGDSLIFSTSCWYTNSGGTRTYAIEGGVVGYNLITIKDTGS
jgi:hypothetical protein